MQISDAVEFVRNNHRAVLSTLKSDGTPQLSPVSVGVDGEGRLLISTLDSAIKTRHLRRDPRAFLVVLSEGFFGEWVQLAGETEVIELPDAMPLLIDYYRSVAGEHPDWEEYKAAMIRDRRVILRVSPSAAGPNTRT